ncbi:MAG: tryptophan--tRNA ligase, partial [Bacteroidales bacterium]|nr:tryptophan--tRNA ligase [Bacteroidales bacterium]
YQVLREGSEYARSVAAQTLHEVRNAMKLNYFDDAELIQTQTERFRQG